MTGPIRVGHSVNLLPLGEVSKVFRTSDRRTRTLLARLGVPVGEDYGELGPVVSQAALEAAIFQDLFVRRRGKTVPSSVVRVHQMLVACDFCVLDRTALLRRLRKFALELTNLRRKK